MIALGLMAGLALLRGAVLEMQHILKPEMLGHMPFLAAEIRLYAVCMLGPSSSECLVLLVHENNH